MLHLHRFITCLPLSFFFLAIGYKFEVAPTLCGFREFLPPSVRFSHPLLPHLLDYLRIDDATSFSCCCCCCCSGFRREGNANGGLMERSGAGGGSSATVAAPNVNRVQLTQPLHASIRRANGIQCHGVFRRIPFLFPRDRFSSNLIIIIIIIIIIKREEKEMGRVENGGGESMAVGNEREDSGGGSGGWSGLLWQRRLILSCVVCARGDGRHLTWTSTRFGRQDFNCQWLH